MPVLSAERPDTVLAPPLPMVNTALNSAGLTFRRGQFSLLAAAPSVGKTLFATNLAIRLPVKSMYLSADSDKWTVKQRACSILTGTELTTVEQQLNDPSWAAYYGEQLHQVDHIDWCYQSDIELEFIVMRLLAHAEIHGEYPDLIVVDNLGNTIQDQDNESAELRAACRELQRIARTTNAHVMALHHVKGAKEDGKSPIGLGDLLYNIGKIPEIVMGLHWQGGDRQALTMTVPKSRGGRGGMSIHLGVDYARAMVGGFQCS